MNIPTQAILFDLDGTLVDNMMVHHRAWQKSLKELGLDYSLERVKAEIHGVNLEILQNLFGDKYTLEEYNQIAWDKEAAYRDIFAADFAANIVPGALDFIRQAHAVGIPMAIGTAGPKENAEFVVENLGIGDLMGHLVHSGMVSRGKPDPEVFQQAAGALGVDLKDCVIFEDSVTGAKAANNAGCPVMVLTTTHTPPEFAALDVASFRPDFRGLRVEQTNDGFMLVG
ncbi:HAD family phosphatase [Neolewinella aurantiaca]|uniref:HAD family phosphatase n=1 Tax=Neolewinella aurantiaca TaxID=2602767 RepID=A0A5C7FHU0_9BACT|nr:HAD family phosphatase [Neolewinella aurantiaca]TXF89384.1 HAD family phosphatase [Neolewinella aurantiaca]